MKTRILFTLFPLTLFSGAAFAADDAKPVRLEEVVVTAPMMMEPLVVVTDPKAPRQPVPAHDGADFLKTIPGFTVIRKGGTDGDPVLRGMAGSRLNISLDGEQILGGCPNRMDPPTAYVFPESYDRITVIKGPQSVLNGAGSSAGSVMFERDIKRPTELTTKATGSVMVGSFGRNDEVLDVRIGNAENYAQAVGTHSRSGSYKDGDGRTVNSLYDRWSINGAFGMTPDDNTRLELTMARSDGKAAYADRTMDGSKFARENYGLKFDQKNVSALIEKIEAQAYYNYVDHVMDSYTLRPGNGASAMAAMNVVRETVGGRAVATLRLAEPTQLKLGMDVQSNMHAGRSGAGPTYTNSYDSKPLDKDANFRNYGLFGEITHYLGQRDKLIGGLRADHWFAQDKRATVTLTNSTTGMTASKANPTYGHDRSSTLASAFGRWERDLTVMPATFYAGFGHSERFPDYWELVSGKGGKESLATMSAFETTNPEKTNQIDVGLIHQAGPLSLSVSGFYNKISDFILIQSMVAKTDNAVARNATITRNVNATTWGGEAGVNYALTSNWKADATLASVRGNNDTDGTALSQLPPLETRFGLAYDNKTYSTGVLLRVVSEQDRFDANKGNIAGQDVGRTAGFGVFSANAGYRLKKGTQLTGGIDNLFNKSYQEHLSRSGVAITGFDRIARVSEPGRNAWVKLNVSLD